MVSRAMPIFVCERVFTTPVSPEMFAAAGERLVPCLQVRESKWLASYLAADGSRSTCLFEAPNAEAVRQANHSAKLPFDRVWEANELRA